MMRVSFLESRLLKPVGIFLIPFGTFRQSGIMFGVNTHISPSILLILLGT